MASTPRLRVPAKEPEARQGQGMEGNASWSGSGEAGGPALLSFDEMPEWFQHENNQWILDGYRPISGSARASFRSWRYLHNETVNIYSHLIPAVVFLLAIFIVGDIVLGVYIIFWCETTLRIIYWSMAPEPQVSLPANTNVRGDWHVGCGALDSWARYIRARPDEEKSFHLYPGGKDRLPSIWNRTLRNVLRKMRFPESWWPGKFDMFSSHSFMHILVGIWKPSTMLTHILPARPLEFAPFCKASNHGDERRPRNPGSAVGDSGGKVAGEREQLQRMQPPRLPKATVRQYLWDAGCLPLDGAKISGKGVVGPFANGLYLDKPINYLVVRLLPQAEQSNPVRGTTVRVDFHECGR
ncbi:hemolysin-III channel protein Izh2 [Cordyceps militaris CM01]|uniref:Hemolysin-III channel protein Izh2 n=1 Tax=Cordyceps militaris (strain CM01) TaxID=983644 RepID=G3J7P7_CORMM|nr:hemolysin-III channel protein Izh2 [Cordyceps militaris CM01]EGX95513.1 hemolysin-III channel protein Izh2 [Cordyceps militaris CM01]